MIDERMYGLGNEPSAIRELFAYGLKRKAEIGDDKVFDYSIGNPSVPAPQKVADTIEELMKLPPVDIIDEKMKNGAGVMLDDVVAAFYAWVVVSILGWLFG